MLDGYIYIYILLATQNPIFVAMILSDYVKDFSIYVIVYLASTSFKFDGTMTPNYVGSKNLMRKKKKNASFNYVIYFS